MDADKKKLLQMKKEQFKLKQKEKEIQKAKDKFVQNVEHFHEKYRFADELENQRIREFISQLDFERPGQLKVKERCPFKHTNVYYCCLMGDAATFDVDIFVFGKYENFISDYDNWEYLSPYVLLIDDDFSHYTYINDYGEIIEQQII